MFHIFLPVLYILKKLIVAILALMYMGTSSGATIHMHYCMEKLIGLSLEAPGDHECGNCGMTKEESKGCCKDKTTQVKLQDDQKISAFVGFFQLFSDAVIITPALNYDVVCFDSNKLAVPLNHAPPDVVAGPIYLRNRSLLI